MTYLGETWVSWDATQTYWHFEHKTVGYNIVYDPVDSYWDTKTGQLKWTMVRRHNWLAQIKNGQEAAVFTDADFVLPGCTKSVNIINDVFSAAQRTDDPNNAAGRNALRRLAKDAKRAARQARRAAKKADVASKKIENALQNMKKK